jgi:hypothetical protein
MYLKGVSSLYGDVIEKLFIVSLQYSTRMNCQNSGEKTEEFPTDLKEKNIHVMITWRFLHTSLIICGAEYMEPEPYCNAAPGSGSDGYVKQKFRNCIN